MSAASVEVFGDHLTFMNADEKPVAIFLLEKVESWTVTSYRVSIWQVAPRDQ